MVKVKLNTSRGGLTFNQKPGDIIEVSVAEGRALCESNQAELVEGELTEKPVKPVEPAPADKQPKQEEPTTEPAPADKQPKQEEPTTEPAPADKQEAKPAAPQPSPKVESKPEPEKTVASRRAASSSKPKD